jgi:UDP-N-acetylmuramoylalanine--D-glutamate ligase
MKLEGRKVVVVGMARSGVAAVELSIEKGASVSAVDIKPARSERLERLGIAIQPQTEAAFAGADLIVLSPGVPADAEAVAAARGRGVPVIGDLELASWFLQGETIGITGSNGKTTTTALTGHILKACGIPAQVGGNIGTPPAAMVASSKAGQWNVLELSSFQLETIETFRAHIGLGLNVSPDHLDRHYTLARYAAAKARLFENQRAGDFAVLNADDPITRGFAETGRAAERGLPYWFSSTREVSPGAWLHGDAIVLGGERLMEAREVPLRGVHNLENAMAAAIAAHLTGAGHARIREAVVTFPGVEHRLEFVRELDGVAWYNDSKATNVDATLKAIAAFPGGASQKGLSQKKLWVILGGKDKDADYAPLAAPLQEKAHAALLIGAAAGKIERQLRGAVPIVNCGTLEAAVEEARSRARSGDTVLLAPACASFDQFDNFEHRGREFKRLVGALGGTR